METGPSSNFRITLKGRVADLAFLTTATFEMAGIWFAYLTIAWFLVAKTLRSVGWSGGVLPVSSALDSHTVVPLQSANVVPAHPITNRPTVPRIVTFTEDKVGSSSTSGQSEDDMEPAVPAATSADQCRPNHLFMGYGGNKPMSGKKFPT